MYESFHHLVHVFPSTLKGCILVYIDGLWVSMMGGKLYDNDNELLYRYIMEDISDNSICCHSIFPIVEKKTKINESFIHTSHVALFPQSSPVSYEIDSIVGKPFYWKKSQYVCDAHYCVKVIAHAINSISSYNNKEEFVIMLTSRYMRDKYITPGNVVSFSTQVATLAKRYGDDCIQMNLLSPTPVL